MICSLVIPGIFTRNIKTYCVEGVLCPTDIVDMTKLFITPACYAQAYTLLGCIILKAVQYGDSDVGLWPLAPDIYFLLLHTIPQLAVQTWLWVEGEAMVTTATFVMSSVGSIVGAVYSVTSLVLGAHSL